MHLIIRFQLLSIFCLAALAASAHDHPTVTWKQNPATTTLQNPAMHTETKRRWPWAKVTIRPLPTPFPTPSLTVPLAPRDAEDCTKAVYSVAPKLTDAPTLPEHLKNIIQTEWTDACVMDDITKEFAARNPELEVFREEAQAWVEAHVGELRDLWQACSDIPQIAHPLTETSICVTLLAEITASHSHNMGPRETGKPVACAAAAVAAGIIAML
ncbi:hypothetical protein B0H63DRAFT_544803 [Podospora didyma]|uniref:Infection structure specific protein n=1 Tax=Podospora didyma TaxID=330526 RepID=A0AAE0NR91_9PEZI|nr:hypothetical protein B0H63DRAFT_544803 [Podospora didyma]